VIRSAIDSVVSGKDLSRSEAAEALRVIMTGGATPAQTAALIVGLRMKGETVDELTGFVEVMREHVTRVRCSAKDVLDTCGTGGDGLRTFNVSTCAAFIAAGAGIKVAKHGNRAMSSSCGSADVLEALGVAITVSAKQAETLLDEVGLAFLFVQAFHPSARYVAPIRREIGTRTLFNLIGPLTNPAFANRQVLGVPKPELTETVGRICANLGMEHVWVVCGHPGMDELSTLGPNTVCEVRQGSLRRFTLDPQSLGLERPPQPAITGGTIEENAQTLKNVLSGEPGPKRDIVLLNAAAALVVGGLAEDLPEGLAKAARVLDRGAAMACLETLAARNRPA
jgi:anthranilate phosphoribosyltransferase